MLIEIDTSKMQTLKDLFKALKQKYDLNYKGWEGFEGLYELYKFKKNKQNKYYELNTHNIAELLDTGKTIIKEW